MARRKTRVEDGFRRREKKSAIVVCVKAACAAAAAATADENTEGALTLRLIDEYITLSNILTYPRYVKN